MIRNFKKTIGLLIVVTGLAASAEGQAPQWKTLGFQDSITENAQRTRMELQRALQFYPPTVGELLRLDPTLLNNKDFMSPFPQLGAYVNQHPEILRNPSFYLGSPSFGSDRQPSAIEERSRAMRDVMEPLSIGTVFLVVIGGILFIIKTAVDYRKWSRISKMQSETHTKLLDRFTSSQDLLTYIETPAGRRFLEFTSAIATDGGSRISAPIGRIVWSAQIGVIVSCAGLGLQYASTRFLDDTGEPVFVLGILGIAVGIGFIFSALVAYATSRSLGLLQPPAAEKPPVQP